MITEGCGVKRVRLMFLATCLAWLERRKRDHHMVALATRDESAAWLASVARERDGRKRTNVANFFFFFFFGNAVSGKYVSFQ